MRPGETAVIGDVGRQVDRVPIEGEAGRPGQAHLPLPRRPAPEVLSAVFTAEANNGEWSLMLLVEDHIT